MHLNSKQYTVSLQYLLKQERYMLLCQSRKLLTVCSQNYASSSCLLLRVLDIFAYCLYLSLMPQFVCAVAWNLAERTGALYWVSERVYTVVLRLSSLQVGKQGSDKFKQHKAVCFSDTGWAARWGANAGEDNAEIEQEYGKTGTGNMKRELDEGLRGVHSWQKELSGKQVEAKWWAYVPSKALTSFSFWPCL